MIEKEKTLLLLTEFLSVDKETEKNQIISRIPKRSEFSENAELQISIPTNSKITFASSIEIIHEYAVNKGWRIEEIVVIKTGGYISCDECKRKLHIHVTANDEKFCMNCGHDTKRRTTTANVRVVE